MADDAQTTPLIPITPKPGGEPCGECHLRPGERCDICGAVRKPIMDEWAAEMDAAGITGDDFDGGSLR